MKDKILETLEKYADSLGYAEMNGEFAPYVIQKEDFDDLATELASFKQQMIDLIEGEIDRIENSKLNLPDFTRFDLDCEYEIMALKSLLTKIGEL